MANEQALFGDNFASSYRLPKAIPAIQVFSVHEGTPELGAISQLPAGAELTFCGSGFNHATVKARCEDRFYFVFLEDVSLQPAGSPSGSENVSHITRRNPGKAQPGKALTASQIA